MPLAASHSCKKIGVIFILQLIEFEEAYFVGEFVMLTSSFSSSVRC